MSNYIKIDNCRNCSHCSGRALRPYDYNNSDVEFYCDELGRIIKESKNPSCLIDIPDDCPYIEHEDEEFGKEVEG